jgi:hypothetical protein
MIKATVQRIFNSMGFQIVRNAVEYTPEELSIIRNVKDVSATGPGRIVGLMDAVKYVVANGIEGAFVECGVWRGGSSMVMAYALKELGDTSRDLYLFDTYEGMPPPTDRDVMFDGTSAHSVLDPAERKEELANYWCMAGTETVRRNVLSTGYPENRIHLIKGKVEETLPRLSPERIAILRLDTDWYESTRHELLHLYPRLSPSGVLIVDDYGHWKGARQAVDEYFKNLPAPPFLSRLDYTGRLAIKPAK